MSSFFTLSRKSSKWREALQAAQRGTQPGTPLNTETLQRAKQATDHYLRTKDIEPQTSTGDSTLLKLLNSPTEGVSQKVQVIACAAGMSAEQVRRLQKRCAEGAALLSHTELRDAVDTVSALAKGRPDVFNGAFDEELRGVSSVLQAQDPGARAEQLAALMVNLGAHGHSGATLVPAIKKLLDEAITELGHEVVKQMVEDRCEDISRIKTCTDAVALLFAANPLPPALATLTDWLPDMDAIAQIAQLRQAAAGHRHAGLDTWVNLLTTLQGPCQDLEALREVLGPHHFSLAAQVSAADEFGQVRALEVASLNGQILLQGGDFGLSALVQLASTTVPEALLCVLNEPADRLELPFDLLNTRVFSPEQAEAVVMACGSEALCLHYAEAKRQSRAGNALQADEAYGAAHRAASHCDLLYLTPAIQAQRLNDFVQPLQVAFAAHAQSPAALVPWHERCKHIASASTNPALPETLLALANWRPDALALAANQAVEGDGAVFGLLNVLQGPARPDVVEGYTDPTWMQATSLRASIGNALAQAPRHATATITVGGAHWTAHVDLFRNGGDPLQSLQFCLTQANADQNSTAVELLGTLTYGALPDVNLVLAATTLANVFGSSAEDHLGHLIDALMSHRYVDAKANFDICRDIASAYGVTDALLTWLRRPPLAHGISQRFWNQWLAPSEAGALKDFVDDVFPSGERCINSLRSLRDWVRPEGPVLRVQRAFADLRAALPHLKVDTGAAALFALLDNLIGMPNGARVRRGPISVDVDAAASEMTNQLDFVRTLRIPNAHPASNVLVQLGDLDERCDVHLHTASQNIGAAIVDVAETLAKLLGDFCTQARSRIQGGAFAEEDLRAFVHFATRLKLGATLNETLKNAEASALSAGMAA